MPSNDYFARRKAEHRAWLREIKRQCERCSEHRSHVLTILDRDTGKGLGMSEGGWSMPIARRDAAVKNAIVLCQKHGYQYRRGINAAVQEEAGRD